jgi:hypothetical protein
MSVSSEVTNVTYSGNNSATIEYPVPFPVTDGSQIRVGIQVPGAAFSQSPSWAYTVVVGPSGTFSVTTVNPVAETSTVVIWREIPATQPVELPLAGRLPSTAIESGLDRATMQIQELKSTLSRAIKMDWSATPQADVAPTPNALFGFDASGNFEPVTAARVRELAQLEGNGANATATWATPASRPSTVPQFTGQVGIQRSDKSAWTALSTTAGDWTPATLPYETVTTEAELLLAIASSRIIRIRGVITLTSTLIITTNDVTLVGEGPNAGLTLPHNGAVQQTVVWVRAQRVKLIGLVITTNHPLLTGRNREDIGVRLAVDTTSNCSGLTVHQCIIRNLGFGILRDGSSTVVPAYDVRITECLFEGIFTCAIYLRWYCHNLRILDNIIRMRTASQTHAIDNNAIYVATKCDEMIIAFNSISRFGRHGIEIWNPSDDPAASASNRNVLVAYNDIREPLPIAGHTPIGITILGKGYLRQIGNTVDGVCIGLEVNGDPVNDGYNIVYGNGVTNSKTNALSINAVTHALVESNMINRVSVDGFTAGGGSPITTECVGAQIINGGRNIRLRNNTFWDAGRHNIKVQGKGVPITGITQATQAVITLSIAVDTTQPNGLYPNKRICIRGLGGVAGSMADLNDKYYTIVSVLSVPTGTQIRINADTTGKTAYTTGGRVQEDYVGLSISDNTFYVYDESVNPNLAGGSSMAIYMYDIQQAIVQGNVRFTKTGLPSGYSTSYALQNYGVAYHDYTGGTVSTTTSSVVLIAGSNQTINVFP